MSDCLFCRIIAQELPATIVYQDHQVVGFADIQPVAPVHILFVPRKHIPALAALEAEDAPLVEHLLMTLRAYAAQEPRLANGYRVVVNSGSQGGQGVEHLHFHLLGGRQLDWPPG